MPEIAGLPEGLEVAGYGIPKENDFEIIGTTIRKGVRPNAAGGLIVKPAPGYTLQPQRIFDIREFKYVDGEPGVYTVVKQFDEPLKMVATASFAFTSVYDRDFVNGLLEKMRELPGCVGVTIE